MTDQRTRQELEAAGYRLVRRETGFKGGSWDENGNFHRSPQTQALLEDYYRNFSATISIKDDEAPAP